MTDAAVRLKMIFVEPKFDNPIHQGMHVLDRLRSAGIPVLGTIWPIGVESGTLTTHEADLSDGTTQYSWRP